MGGDVRQRREHQPRSARPQQGRDLSQILLREQQRRKHEAGERQQRSDEALHASSIAA
jgi:hypothetical protein